MGVVRTKHVDFFEILSGLYLLLMILMVLIISAVGDHKIFYVLVGFLPVILVIMISMMIHEQYAKHNAILWLLPIIINVAFYFIGSTSPGFAAQFDVDVLTGINFIFSVVYVLIVFSVFMKDFKKEIAKKEKLIVKEEKKSLQEYIHSIEDKSKALNFAIGRVYNKYHGGTTELRDKLRIPAEWYNEFSLIGVGTDKIDFEKLNDIITKFELQLKNFEKTEYEVFKDKANSLKNLIRDVKGTDIVIDVLDHNDKDPVSSYYKGAVEFCTKIKEEIKNNDLKLVENKYIPKDEDEMAEITGKQHPNKPHINKPNTHSNKVTSAPKQSSAEPKGHSETTINANKEPKKSLSDLPPIAKKEEVKKDKKKKVKVVFDRRPPNLHP